MTLYLPVGIPGCGKSTYCRHLCSTRPQIVYLSSDGLRGVMGKDENDQSVSGRVFDTLETMVDFFLRHSIDVMVDATNVTKKSRGRFVAAARKHNAQVLSFSFDVPFEVSAARNAARERVVPLEVLQRMHNNLEIPEWPEVDNHIVIPANWQEAEAEKWKQAYQV